MEDLDGEADGVDVLIGSQAPQYLTGLRFDRHAGWVAHDKDLPGHHPPQQAERGLHGGQDK